VTAYREEVRDLANVIMTKEMIVDYRKRRTGHAPIVIDAAVVEFSIHCHYSIH
jgi:hypothetical protein